MNRLVALVLLTACASKTPTAPATPVDEPAMPPFADQMEPKAETPDLSATGQACAQEIAIVCDEGFVDGCGLRTAQGTSLTLDHVCVAADAKPGPPCTQEIAAACDDGYEDACMTAPPLSTGHVCVQSRE